MHIKNRPLDLNPKQVLRPNQVLLPAEIPRFWFPKVGRCVLTITYVGKCFNNTVLDFFKDEIRIC